MERCVSSAMSLTSGNGTKRNRSASSCLFAGAIREIALSNSAWSWAVGLRAVFFAP